MRRSVVPVNLIGKEASEFSTHVDIRMNLYASVVSSVRGIVAHSLARSHVVICKDFFANVVPAGGTRERMTRN